MAPPLPLAPPPSRAGSRLLLTMVFALLLAPQGGALPPGGGPALPSPRSATSAVWTGHEAYVFGGFDGTLLNEVVRFTPSTGEVEIMGGRLPTITDAVLPTGRSATSAVWTGHEALIFGGGNLGDLQDILRYDPTTDEVHRVGAKMAQGRTYSSAVWDGHYAYVFGGLVYFADLQNAQSYEILRYDPATDTLDTLPYRLPTARSDASAAWDGHTAYILGGANGTTLLDDIVAFTPTTGETRVLEVRLPTPRSATEAVWTGESVLLLGGFDGQLLDEIVRFTPSTGTVEVLAERLPSPRSDASAAWAGAHGYYFGGFSGLLLDEIVRVEG